MSPLKVDLKGLPLTPFYILNSAVAAAFSRRPQLPKVPTYFTLILIDDPPALPAASYAVALRLRTRPGWPGARIEHMYGAVESVHTSLPFL